MSGGEQVTIRVARRIFVGNLSWQTSWQDLKDHFGTVGRVVFADVLREDGPGSRSKGCGIVEYETPDEAAAAILELHDSELGGRKIWVREDREDFELRGEGGPRRGGGGYDRSGGSYDRGYDRGYRNRSRSPLHRGGGGFRGDFGGRREPAATVGRRVYVGNLSFETTWQELKDHFKAAGRVAHADVLTDAEGRSRGCGIVEFDHPADALHAISMLSNSTLGGRQIHVREDREDPAAHAPRGGGGGGGGGGGYRGAPGTQVVVHGLPFKFSWQDLKDLARPAGAVVHADIAMGGDGRSKGWGTVAFATPSDANAAVDMLNGKELEGRTLACHMDKFVAAQALQRCSAAQPSERRRRGGVLVVCTQQRKDPKADPNYRRSSQNDYWRKPQKRGSMRGTSVSADNEKRRRGRSAHLRSPDDTPLRDGNRDRLMGLLTDRAARTLAASVDDDNPALNQWMGLYLGEHSIPKDGNWSDVSGENFLRTLLTKPVEEISGSFSDEDDSFLTRSPVGGDPRAIASRIMELRHDIAKEWLQELELVKEENMLLISETLMKSMGSKSNGNGSGPAAAEGGGQGGTAGEAPPQPPLRKVDIEEVDDSAGGGDD
ncbi:RNA binding isoform C [Chlorella sorokiniana]|uniref:RNA binding isoform B n=1 Tax=Chlorella sorokiniana TaxID=3076 RepID=A0A2P6U156_CHLSO|nr:RNA binding isoform B [Chlorella sorokiniana]PRW60042.1 RNA binding isoform C [Chlorella sorokiniana]|eukprot:PRW60040.1 RNA binding isoform B [Chlorella sorokiniana]